jgi:hypothetical protein
MSASPTSTNAPPASRPEKARPSSSISAVAWVPVREMEFPEWAEAGRRLGAMGRCGQWGLGDWIRYGNTKFGERYAWAARVTAYDSQTLMNMVYVASRFEISRRRENLSWSHHETLAALQPDEQDYWLDRAIADHLSVSDLRLELRASRRNEASPSADCHKPATRDQVTAVRDSNNSSAIDGGPGGLLDSNQYVGRADSHNLQRAAVLICPRCGHRLEPSSAPSS